MSKATFGVKYCDRQSVSKMPGSHRLEHADTNGQDIAAFDEVLQRLQSSIDASGGDNHDEKNDVELEKTSHGATDGLNPPATFVRGHRTNWDSSVPMVSQSTGGSSIHNSQVCEPTPGQVKPVSGNDIKSEQIASLLEILHSELRDKDLGSQGLTWKVMLQTEGETVSYLTVECSSDREWSLIIDEDAQKNESLESLSILSEYMGSAEQFCTEFTEQLKLNQPELNISVKAR